MKNYEGVIRYAMQMELDGYNFFKDNAEKFINPTSKELFLKLAQTEMEHYKYLENQLNSYVENKKFDLSDEVMNREENIFEKREESEHIEATLEQSDIPDITILRMAYLIEKDYKEFYQKQAEEATDEDVKKIFEKLSGWEASHEQIFKNEYDRRMKEYMSLPWGG